MPDHATEITVKLTEEEKRRIEEQTGEQIDELVVPTANEFDSDQIEPQSVRF